MDYLFSLNDKVRAKYCPFTRLDLVHTGTTAKAIQSFEGCHSKTFLITIVIREFNQWQTLVPFVRLVQYTSSKHILKNLIYPLCLTIGLQMISQAMNQMHPQGSMQLLPEESYELGTSIRNDGLRHTMQTQDVRNIQLIILFSPVEGVHWNEMNGLGKSVDDYPDGVQLAASERQTHNEIHIDVFAFPGRNTQRLQQSCMPHLISLDPLTHVAFRNITSSLTFHTGPPELCLQIMIHLCAAWVDGIFGSVSFIKYLLAQTMVLWNHQTILEPESAFLIHVKIVDFRVTFSQPPLNVHDSRIEALSCNDFSSQHRGEGHFILSHDRGYLNARFFPGDTDSGQVVIVSFVTQGICNHVCLTRVIVNFKIIVLDQLQPSSLSHAQIRLSEKVLQALVISEDISHIPKKIMTPGMQGMNYNDQLKIMSGILLFKWAQLM
jgi:hypothetical protein